MASIVSKNLFELLDDDAADSSQVPATSKAANSASKGTQRGAVKPAEASRGGRGNRDGASGNEAAYRDRGAGSQQNRGRGTDENRGEGRGRGRGGRDGGRGRGGRGGRGGQHSDDRHSKTGIVDHDKQTGRGWGGNTGDAEYTDEKEGEAIAQADEKEAEKEIDDNGEPTEPAEEEVKTKTYDDYLAEQAEKRLQISGSLAPRKPNDGGNKKLNQGKELEREEETDFITGVAGKKGRERAKKEKNILELDGEAMRQTDRTERRGRGRGGPRGDFGDRGDRGGRGRGDFSDRPPRGEGGDRGERGGFRGRGRGDGARGGRGGDFRGGDRGRGAPRGRGGSGANAPNVTDESAFPSLGS
ncbi:hypothetical protein BT63DRAFT_456020 [Microthyrium microscopicum]|uniref:Hyaluronan/mRNA-binding protein domain-containing protein n=1 Tax=Microthyrium microscopicum TaxID=703497 RepID=A0A6A6UBT0_9PEZI|nr:hypothetical protein BT63DRAFT_456020 [Microthyrium microscopicum]